MKLATVLSLMALLILVVAAPLLAQELLVNGGFARADAKGLPENWRLQLFHESLVPEVAALTEGERHACRFTFNETSDKWCLSFYQALPDLDTEGQMVVKFWLKTETAAPPFVSISLSGAPGCNLPCRREFLSPVNDRQWHEVTVTFLLRGQKEKGSVLEFVMERAFAQGDKVYLADVTAEYRTPWEATMHLTDPVSGVVFTDAPTQRLAGVLKVPKSLNGARATLHLESAGKPGQALDRQELTLKHPTTPWAIDLTKQPEGKYVVIAEFPGQAAQPPQRRQAVAWRLRPGENTTRVINGRVYRGGKPVLLLGTYHVADWALGSANAESKRIGAPEVTRQQMLSGLAQHGFNSFVYTNGVPPLDFLSQAQALGLTLLPSVSGLGREWGGKPLAEQLAPWQDDPRLFGWYGADEPSAQTIGRAVEVYRDLKSVSPHKLVATSFCWPEALLAQAGEDAAADLVLMDIYLINQPNADLSGIGLAVRDAVAYARQYGSLAVGVAPQMFIFAGGPEPTPEQLRAQLYLGLVNGAVAFVPYSYIEDYGEKPFSAVKGQPTGMSLNPKRDRWFLPDSKLWLVLPQIFGELKALEKVIIEDGQPLGVTAEQTPVQWVAKRVGNESYLIAANPLAGVQRVAFVLPPAAGKLKPLFGTPAAEV
ncbi:MAG: hypothetical protein WCP21_17535, partial [Armatimonadota bacterium]